MSCFVHNTRHLSDSDSDLDIFFQTQSNIINNIFKKRIIHTNDSDVIIHVNYLWKIT